MRNVNLLKSEQLPFWSKYYLASQVIIISDYDGTLSPLKANRSRAFLYEEIRPLIEKLLLIKSLGFVINSGRPAREVSELLGLSKIPEIWGVHGWERLMPDGSFKRWPIDSLSKRGLKMAATIAATKSLMGYIENKYAALAVHWRGIPACEKKKIIEFIECDLKRIADKYKLLLTNFDGGIELRVNGRNKGDGIREIVKNSKPDTLFVYLGDDLTDEDAFEAIARAGGFGILVNKIKRHTKAQFQLVPPEEVFDFLKLCVMLKEV
jgi:trehalose 6-phosphate phosphatase